MARMNHDISSLKGNSIYYHDILIPSCWLYNCKPMNQLVIIYLAIKIRKQVKKPIIRFPFWNPCETENKIYVHTRQIQT